MSSLSSVPQPFIALYSLSAKYPSLSRVTFTEKKLYIVITRKNALPKVNEQQKKISLYSQNIHN